MAPNVVLIMADQWRGDCLSAAGHEVVRTPYLDNLARQGARFTRAYSASPSCIPARASLHTGLSARHHGRVGYRDGVDWDFPVTLAGEFSRHGFQTRAIGKMHAAPARNRLGFDEVLLHDGYLHYGRSRAADHRFTDDYLTWLRRQPSEGLDADHNEHGLDTNSMVARPWGRAERLHPTNWVVTEAIDFLYRRDPRQPFFLNLSFHRPHPPLDPPSWAFEQYLSAPQYEPVRGDWTSYLEKFRQDDRADANVARYDPVSLQRARAGYFGHMAHIDQQIQRFRDTLAEFGLEDDTVVCFTSDHGDMFGEHDLWRKSLPYEGSTHVPLLLRRPGAPGGVVRDQVVELRDVMPTLLDSAGLPVPEGLDGRSLVPAADGDSAPLREYLHGEHTYAGRQSVHAITDRRYKYVWYSGDGHEQLFDLASDPRECHDLAGDADCADLLQERRRRLIDELAEGPEGYVDSGHLVAGRRPFEVLPR